MIDQAVADLRGLHTVVHAAGPHVPMVHLSRVDPDAMADQLSADAAGFFAVAHAALPALRASAGSLVAVTTAATTRFPIRDGLSSAPKAAVEAMVRGARGRGGPVRRPGQRRRSRHADRRHGRAPDLLGRARRRSARDHPRQHPPAPVRRRRATSPRPSASSRPPAPGSSPARSSTSTGVTAPDAESGQIRTETRRSQLGSSRIRGDYQLVARPGRGSGCAGSVIT